MDSICGLVQNFKLPSFCWGFSSAWRVPACLGAGIQVSSAKGDISAGRRNVPAQLHGTWAGVCAQLSCLVRATAERVCLCLAMHLCAYLYLRLAQGENILAWKKSTPIAGSSPSLLSQAVCTSVCIHVPFPQHSRLLCLGTGELNCSPLLVGDLVCGGVFD